MFNKLLQIPLLVCIPIILFPQNELLDSLQNALKLSREDTDKVALLNKLASQYQFMDPQQAMKYAMQSVDLSKKLKYDYGLATAYRLAGVFSVDKSDFNSGTEFYKKSLGLVGGKKDLRSRRLFGMLQHNFGVIAHYQDEYSRAVQYYTAAAKIYTEIEDEGLLFLTYNNLANIYALLIDKNNALKYANECMRLSEKLKDSAKIAIASVAVASANMELKRYDNMEQYLKRAERISRETSNYYMLGKTYGLLGQYESEGNKDNKKSIAYAKSALLNSEKSGNQFQVAVTHQQLGEGYVALGNYQEAKSEFLKTIKMSRELGILQIEQYSLNSLAGLEEKNKNPSAALEYLRKYILANDSIHTKANQQQVNALESKYQSEIKEYKIEQLQKEKQIQQLSIRQKSALSYLLFIGLITVLVISVLLFKNYKRKQALAEQRIQTLEKDKQLVAVDAMLKGQEEERSRLAKDLHDGLGGILSGVKYSLISMKDNMVITEENAAVFERSLDLIDTSIQELRRVSHNMMPEALVKFGLDEALKDYTNAINTSNILQVNYQSFGMEKRMDSNTEIIIYRIIQELLNNIMKHAGATEALVQLVHQENRLSITVEDNGKGFDVNDLTKSKGAGWANIRNRVNYLKGSLDLQSGPGQPTSVNIEIPG